MTSVGRKKTPYERPFNGFRRAGGERAARIFRARVTGVFPDERSVECSWEGRRGSPVRVPIFGDIGSYSLPTPGDIVMVVVDSADQPFVIGCRDIAFPDRVSTSQVPPLVHGERGLFSKEFRQRLFFREDGSLQLFVRGDEGLEVLPTRRVRLRAPQLFEVISNAGKMLFGVVRRPKGTSTTLDEDEVITNPPGIPGATPHKEFFVDVNYQVPTVGLSKLIRAFRLVGGTGVISDDGTPELGSLGAPLRAVIEVMSVAGGTSIASIQMDELGNLALSSTAIAQIQAQVFQAIAPFTWIRSQVIMLGSSPVDVVLYAIRFLGYYNQHVHKVPQLPAGFTVSEPPLIRAPEPMMCSKSVLVA